MDEETAARRRLRKAAREATYHDFDGELFLVEGLEVALQVHGFQE